MRHVKCDHPLGEDSQVWSGWHQTFTTINIWSKDPDPVDWPNLHNYKLVEIKKMQEQKWDPFVCQLCSIENFLEHVRQKMCDPFICQLYFIKIFRTKKCDKKMWPYCLRILLIKVRHKKSVTLLIEEDRHCQARHVHVDRLNFNNYTLTGILLKKVLHKKCDP